METMLWLVLVAIGDSAARRGDGRIARPGTRQGARDRRRSLLASTALGRRQAAISGAHAMIFSKGPTRRPRSLEGRARYSCRDSGRRLIFKPPPAEPSACTAATMVSTRSISSGDDIDAIGALAANGVTWARSRPSPGAGSLIALRQRRSQPMSPSQKVALTPVDVELAPGGWAGLTPAHRTRGRLARHLPGAPRAALDGCRGNPIASPLRGRSRASRRICRNRSDSVDTGCRPAITCRYGNCM